VITVQLDIKNPKIEASAPMMVLDRDIRRLKAEGYDALIQDVGSGRYDIVVFDKNQIKPYAYEPGIPGELVADWVSGVSGSPGIVVDPGVARSTPCTRIDLGDGMKALVFSKGIIGALDKEQQALYCQLGYTEQEATPKQRERISNLSQAAKLCSAETAGIVHTEEHLTKYFSCLGRELRAKGEST